MKRDIELIKKILLDVEGNESPRDWIELEYDNFTKEEIYYHVKLLNQAGLIEADDVSSFDGFVWRATSLTWYGHEFIDAARNDTVWNKTKKMIKEKGGSVPFSIVSDFLKQAASDYFLK